MNQAATMDKARPNRPVCSSQSFRFHINDFGVPRGTVAPGTKTKQTKAMTTTGTPMAISDASHTGTVSLSV
jgi:hypothetical protein